MSDVFGLRMGRLRQAMADRGVEVTLLSVGAELPWLTGYTAMPLERLTMLVVPVDGEATLVVPALEAARVTPRPQVFGLRAWQETEDPVDIVAGLLASASHLAIGDRTWARFLVELQKARPGLHWQRANEVVGPLRMRKDDAEIDALQAAAAAADRVAHQLQEGKIALVGQTEAAVSAELGRLLVSEGHQKVNFAIVASGPNAASPHHDPGERLIQPGEVVLCDFGGTMLDATGVGYCSDITRCVWTGGGEVPAELQEVYATLQSAQAAARASAVLGATCEAVDQAARRPIAEAGWGEQFIHRTGHGIGIEEHEDPYIVAGNQQRLEGGHAFSIEPGIYVAGRWGFRLEDILVATPDGPRSLNRANRDLVVTDA